MTNSVDALILDLLEWIGPKPRAYAEVMEAWRTSCPRLPVWEEANARGFVAAESAKPRRTTRPRRNAKPCGAITTAFCVPWSPTTRVERAG